MIWDLIDKLNSIKNKKACKSYDLQAFEPIWICFSGVDGVLIEHLLPILTFLDSLKIEF